MDNEKFTPIPPETDGWDDAANENPKVVRIHRLFFATGVFCAVAIAALAFMYFLPISIKPSKDYEYHVRRFDYWFKKNKSGQKLEIRYGKEKRWNADGKLTWQRDWSGDKWDGWEKKWYLTGQLRNEQHWHDGKKDGDDRWRHANGQLWRETHWKDDVQQGDAQVWDESGKSMDEPKVAKTLNLGDGIMMDMMLIPAGDFMMGSDNDNDNAKPIHKVKITQPFYMGKFEVSQEQYEKIMGTNPSSFKGAMNPVEQVSWDDAQDFCKKLSAKTGMTVTLPTEAQWEYACRAGSTTKYYFGDDDNELGDYAWYYANSGNPRYQTHPVGQKIPNAFGLHDMSGNVWEWCSDLYGDYPSGDVVDPKGSDSGASRVLRGGSWLIGSPDFCRSAYRFRRIPVFGYYYFGFRVVASRTP